MADLRFSIEWLSSGSHDPILRDTSAQLAIQVDDICLTRHEDTWSRTVRDPVLVSTYPLALWLASSWWRLNFEPLPERGLTPPIEWRMAHELGAANHGFVWPRILFVSDGEAINVWAEPITSAGQSVQYLNGLEAPRSIAIQAFQNQIDGFMDKVLSRLVAVGHVQTDLAALWSLIQADRVDPEASRIRRLEAQLGFDPEECPEEFIAKALAMQEQTGTSAMSELAPVFGRQRDEPLHAITELMNAHGLCGRPQVSRADIQQGSIASAPWQQGVDSARQLRAHIGNENAPIDDAALVELLGLTRQQVDQHQPARSPVAVARPRNENELDFVPRKRHPIAKRFEFARFLGACLDAHRGQRDWLVASDLATASQKRQRAFAAEFLCPIESLVDLLHGDYSESSIEEAAEHYQVSPQTVESLLANNGYLSFPPADSLPYRLAA